MLDLILTLSLAALSPAAQSTAQFRPCVWPNKCAVEAPVTVAQFRPCVWPNKCAKVVEKPVTVAQFRPCVWPNKCAKGA